MGHADFLPSFPVKVALANGSVPIAAAGAEQAEGATQSAGDSPVSYSCCPQPVPSNQVAVQLYARNPS